jgi:ribonuclease VapC
MVIDASSVIAIMREEPGFDLLKAALSAATSLSIGAPTLLECHIVSTRRYGAAGSRMLAGILYSAGIQVVPFTEDHWRISADAFDRYGIGRHRAALNFGDCMSYAVARLAREPLLFVGDDFRQTDIQPAL